MKALIHVQHLLGTGHIVRAAAIGRALAAQGVAVVLATGNRPPPTLDTTGLTVAALPFARARDSLFKVILDAAGNPIDAAWQAARAEATRELFCAVRPDILLTETWPFGRRAFAFEMLPLLELARGQTRPPLVAASIRDILVQKADPAKERAMAEIAATGFDRVLVHADPALIRLEESFRFADRIADRIRYTGFVHDPSRLEPPGEDGRDEVIVSAGGGAVGAHLIAAAGQARALSRRAGDTPWRVLVGHGHGDAALARLQAEAGEALEDDAGEIVPVADDVGEDTDEQRLLHQPGDDVLVRAPGPEECGQRHVDDDQRGGDEGDLAAKQAEAAVDVTGENTQKVVDDAGAAHGSLSPVLMRGGGHRRPAEEPVAVLGPGGEAAGIVHGGLA